MTDEPILEALNLTRHFRVGSSFFGLGRDEVVRAVDGVSLEVRRGETLALVGESGCGKSTLGRMLVGLLEPTSGTIRFKGQELRTTSDRAVRKALQIVFQDPFSSLNPRKTIRHIIGRPLAIHGLAREDREARIRELLSLVHLEVDTLDRYPHEFSGGQQQRIAIARALATEPDLIVADEPVSALDVSVQAQIVALLVELRARMNLALVLITHDLAMVRYIADRVAIMYLGQIVEAGDAAEIFERPSHPYTAGLLASTGVLDPRQRGRRIALQGELPSPIDPPSGCRFRTRCRFRLPVCERICPELLEVGPTHLVACHLFRDGTAQNGHGRPADAGAA